MSNARYAKASQALAAAGIDWVSDTIKAQMLDLAAYTANLATDEFITDIPSGAKIGAAVTLTGKSNVLGVLDAADISFSTGFGTGTPTCEGLVIWKDTGTPATSRLIFLVDTATGLPTAANAPGVDVVWNNGSDKIARI